AKYDPFGNVWTSISPMAYPRADAAYAYMPETNRIVVFGGCSGAGACQNTIEIYQVASDTWMTMTSPSLTARKGMASGWNGTHFVVWGGTNYSGGTYYSDGASYDVSGDTWTPISTGPLGGRLDMAYTMTGERLAIWGGYNGSFLGDGAVYDSLMDTWNTIPAS